MTARTSWCSRPRSRRESGASLTRGTCSRHASRSARPCPSKAARTRAAQAGARRSRSRGRASCLRPRARSFSARGPSSTPTSCSRRKRSFGCSFTPTTCRGRPQRPTSFWAATCSPGSLKRTRTSSTTRPSVGGSARSSTCACRLRSSASASALVRRCRRPRARCWPRSPRLGAGRIRTLRTWPRCTARGSPSTTASARWRVLPPAALGSSPSRNSRRLRNPTP
mmetsp:Transcript_6989/g.14451  ORF Transcript_6989/g.14451 Transcript_6989/m.14451 type:complete len:224 (-) Transcript_6989:178-849(-)